MKTIRLGCPAGSGLNFALRLLKASFDYKVDFLAVGHERKDILEESPTIVILRDPYDTIASGSERFIKSSNHRYFSNETGLLKEDDIIPLINQIMHENSRYVKFFTDIENLKHVKVLGFDTLTQDPDLFVKQVSEHFNIEEKIVKIAPEKAIQDVIDSGNANRVPRKKNAVRIKIDRYVKAIYPEEEFESLKIYLDLKYKINDGLI